MTRVLLLLAALLTVAACSSAPKAVDVSTVGTSASSTSTTTTTTVAPATTSTSTTTTTAPATTTTTAPPTTTTTLAPEASVEAQQVAQALIDETAALVGDLTDERRQRPPELLAMLQAVADGSAFGDQTAFDGSKPAFVPHQVSTRYLMCPIVEGELCGGTVAAFRADIAACAGGSAPWAAELVVGAAGWAAMAQCWWQPSPQQFAAAASVADASLQQAAAAAGSTLERTADFDAAAVEAAADFETARSDLVFDVLARSSADSAALVIVDTDALATPDQAAARVVESFTGALSAPNRPPSRYGLAPYAGRDGIGVCWVSQ